VLRRDHVMRPPRCGASVAGSLRQAARSGNARGRGARDRRPTRTTGRGALLSRHIADPHAEYARGPANGAGHRRTDPGLFSELNSQPLRRHEPVSVGEEVFKLVPVDRLDIDVDTDPTVMRHVGRQKEPAGIRVDAC